jgi:lysophospholipid acyltransferase (LPLAT)-like uncharacterized protein
VPRAAETGWKGWLLPPLARGLIRGIGATVRLTVRGEERLDGIERLGKKAVFAFFHGRQFLLVHLMRGRGIGVIASLSRDGELQARTLGGLGFSIVRGSSSRGGVRALLGIVRLMAKGRHVCFAVDGPRGPLHRVKPGVIFIAKRSGSPILPLAAAAGPSWVFARAWDRYQLPRPFARGVVLFGEPWTPDGDMAEAAMERDALELERRLLALQEEAERLLRGNGPTREGT